MHLYQTLSGYTEVINPMELSILNYLEIRRLNT
jgi:hypothetical protein